MPLKNTTSSHLESPNLSGDAINNSPSILKEMKNHWLYPIVIALTILVILTWIYLYKVIKSNKNKIRTQNKNSRTTFDLEKGDVSMDSIQVRE